MVDISIETSEETHARLIAIIRSAHLELYHERYRFTEFDDTDFPAAIHPCSLALVRDGDRWSQLEPCQGTEEEPFAVFSFHFPDGQDNSGFVGWLASRLKDRFGTGVFVICGHNGARGGVFDYWGCPASLADDVFAEIKALNVGEA